MEIKNHLKEIREHAKCYYIDNDFRCSESVLKVILENFKTDLPDEVVSLATGFVHGVGHSGCVCGAVAGGTMALGIFFGRSVAKEDDKLKKCMEVSNELHKMFKSNHKTTCCRVLTKKVTYASPEHRQQCARFVGEVVEATAKIIIREKGADIIKDGVVSG